MLPTVTADNRWRPQIVDGDTECAKVQEIQVEMLMGSRQPDENSQDHTQLTF